MVSKGKDKGAGKGAMPEGVTKDETLQQAALAVVRQCMGGQGYKTDAEARAVCPALVGMLGERSIGVRRNACAALAALAGCHGAGKGCGGALVELGAPAAAAKCLADGGRARDGPLAANAAQAVAALANGVGAYGEPRAARTATHACVRGANGESVLTTMPRPALTRTRARLAARLGARAHALRTAGAAKALVDAGAPAAAAATVKAAVAGGEWEAAGDAAEAAEMCAGAAMDAVCALGAADELAHHGALLEAGCAEAAVDMVVAMLGPAATMQALVRAPAWARGAPTVARRFVAPLAALSPCALAHR